MKRLFRKFLKCAPVVALLIGGGLATQAQTAKLQLDQLDSLANRATETVDVKLDEKLLQTVSKWLGKDADDADIKEIIKNLKGIYVKSFTFEKEGEYSPAEIESVTSQLRAGNWNKIVGVRSRKDGENVDVYLLQLGDQIEGLALVSAEPKEFTVVNIVGPVNLEKLTQLEGKFGVPDFDLPPSKSKLIK